MLRLDEQVLTFKLTPNRADCLSVLGDRAGSRGAHRGETEGPEDQSGAGEEQCKASRQDHRRRRLRALRRARDPQRRRRGADAGVDARAPGARGAALDLGAGGRHQLRDARARPPAARLRPGQAARARSTCAGAARARRCCCSTARRSTSIRRCCASPTIPAPIGLAGIMGGEIDQGRDHDEEPVPRVRVLLSRRHRRPRAALQLRERRLAPLRARRGLRQQRRTASSARRS